MFAMIKLVRDTRHHLSLPASTIITAHDTIYATSAIIIQDAIIQPPSTILISLLQPFFTILATPKTKLVYRDVPFVVIHKVWMTTSEALKIMEDETVDIARFFIGRRWEAKSYAKVNDDKIKTLLDCNYGMRMYNQTL
ncbi:hypothetical protein Lser_V15G21824 [Lactuca serriola]